MFYSSGIIIAFFLSVLLIIKQRQTTADKILAAWLFFIGVHLLFFYLNFSGQIYGMPFLLGPDLPLPLVHGPFLYLYTAALCDPRPAPPRRWLVHFLPALLGWAYLCTFYFLPPAQKIWVYQNRGAGYEPFLWVRSVVMAVSAAGYVVASALLLRRHARNIHNLFSYEERINLQWLRYLIAGLSVIWVVVFTGHDPLVFGAAVLLVLFIGIFGIRQVGIFSAPAGTGKGMDGALPKGGNAATVMPPNSDSASTGEMPSPFVEPDKKKYQKSGLTEASAAELHRQLLHLMETRHVYRESELSLTDLAERLNTHPNYLSQVINEQEGKNFFDYVNTLRVGEFLKLAADPKNRRFTLLALALDCGFNSKSSFIRYFKKVTGLPPSKYLQLRE